MNERRAPLLVLAVGNPSRGDDALGPMLAERLESAALPGVEVITEFQLQVENALDLEGRERVIFVDAGVGTGGPFEAPRGRAGGRIPAHLPRALAGGRARHLPAHQGRGAAAGHDPLRAR